MDWIRYAPAILLWSRKDTTFRLRERRQAGAGIVETGICCEELQRISHQCCKNVGDLKSGSERRYLLSIYLTRKGERIKGERRAKDEW